MAVTPCRLNLYCLIMSLCESLISPHRKKFEQAWAHAHAVEAA